VRQAIDLLYQLLLVARTIYATKRDG